MVLSKKHLLFTLILLLAFFLRFFELGSIPPSLYTDEANQGYNAYSILETLRDEHGIFLPVSLRSFGDWKPPLPTLLMIPFIKLVGLNEISVRLPSAFLSMGTILIFYFLIRHLLVLHHRSVKIALLSSFVLSVSPWSILQSRSAMLVSVSLFFLILGIWLFLIQKRKSIYMVFAFMSFSLSIYAYYGMRIIMPLVLLYLCIRFYKNVLASKKTFIVSVFVSAILMVPLLLGFLNERDVIFGRARTVSVFYDQGIILRQWELFTQDGISYNQFLSRLFHNKSILFAKDIISRFLSHFEGNYLFITGDKAQPFQIPGMGILYLLEAVLIPLGIVAYLRSDSKMREFMFVLLFISVLPAAFTFMTPSSNRTYSAVIPLSFFCAFGLVSFSSYLRNNLFFSILITYFYCTNILFFTNSYFLVLPKKYESWWNFGWKEVVSYVSKIEDEYENIVVSDKFGMPYIYFLFYKNYPPLKYQSEAVRTYKADEFGFEHVEGFGKYLFPNDLDWERTKENPLPKSLYIIPQSQAGQDEGFVYKFLDTSGNAIFKAFSYE